MAEIFEFTDYKLYLEQALKEAAEKQKGARSAFAESLGCQPSHISRVLSEKAQLSLEQAERANRFFGHNFDESAYFLLLVESARAGTEELRSFLNRQIFMQREANLNLQKRFKMKSSLSVEDQNIYYGSWQYSAIHLALLVPIYRHKKDLAKKFSLTQKRVGEILEFLVRTGLAQQQGETYLPGVSWIHLEKESSHAMKNHVNWRVRAIQSLENPIDSDLHYTSTFTISEKDVLQVKTIFVEAIERARAVIQESKDERVCSLLIDLFEF